MSEKIDNLLEYAESLVRPIKVLVVDTEPESFAKVVSALAPYEADVFNASCGCEAALCLQKLAPFDLAFVGYPLKTYGTPANVVSEIQRVSPDASVVIMARTVDEPITDLLESGPFTFLKKNGNFDDSHVQKIASHLNLKLRPSEKARVENRNLAPASVNRV